MDRSTKFWDRVAERYSKQPIADEAAYQKKLQTTREYFRADMDVLEFGCGTASTAMLHAPYVRHIQGIDISPKMVGIAQSKVDAENIRNISLQCADINYYEVRDQSLDAVLGLSILHLLEDKEKVISRVYQMLKPGGVFITNTACIADMMRYFKVIAPIGAFFGLIPTVKIFTAVELKSSLTEAGFDIEYQWQRDKKAAIFIIAKKPV